MNKLGPLKGETIVTTPHQKLKKLKPPEKTAMKMVGVLPL